MLNQMGDGGPFVFKEWDEAVASMAMCEEATFVFSKGATQRAMMPYVGCRKAPPGTVLVVEVGLINVKRDGGRRQEVNDFLTAKFVAERRQQKLDRLDEQKFMRLRMKQGACHWAAWMARALSRPHTRPMWPAAACA